MKENSTKKFLIILLGVCAIFGTCKFEYDSRSSNFVPVEEIKGVPTGGVKGYEFTLNRSVYPSTATNQAIVWSIAEDGETNATLNRNKLTATESGTVTVRALIKDGKARGVDYAQEFEIEILDEYIEVNAIQDIPTKISIGTYKLEGTVKPNNAVNKTIIWELKDAGTTGAILNGDVLTVTTMGKLTLTALVEKGAGPDTDFRQDLEIRVAPISVTSITGFATGCMVGDHTLFAIVSPRNATFKNISWEVKSAGVTGAVINGNVLTTTSRSIWFDEYLSYYGEPIKVRAIVKDGVDFDYDYIQDFEIGINDTHYPVTSLENPPIECSVGDFTLFVTVVSLYYYATNRTVIWEIEDAGGTGAVIDGDVLTTTAPGTVKLTAIVKDGTAPGVDYTQEFSMDITE
jgi:hypothetical protein